MVHLSRWEAGKKLGYCCREQRLRHRAERREQMSWFWEAEQLDTRWKFFHWGWKIAAFLLWLLQMDLSAAIVKPSSKFNWCPSRLRLWGSGLWIWFILPLISSNRQRESRTSATDDQDACLLTSSPHRHVTVIGWRKLRRGWRRKQPSANIHLNLRKKMNLFLILKRRLIFMLFYVSSNLQTFKTFSGVWLSLQYWQNTINWVESLEQFNSFHVCPPELCVWCRNRFFDAIEALNRLFNINNNP